MGLRIAQINAQRSSAAAADLEIIMREGNIDILCLQEPYLYKGKVRGYTSSGCKVIQPDGTNPWVAVVAVEEKLQIFRVACEETEHLLCLHVVSEADEFYLINIYCQFSMRIEPFLINVEKVLNNLNSNKVIVLMDSNARSPLWFSNETDERGKIVEEFLLSRNLFVINEPNNPPTFLSVNGQSNIDVTLVSESMLTVIGGWRVLSDCTTSDHNLIVFDYNRNPVQKREIFKQNIYNIKKANWENLVQLAKERFNDSFVDNLNTLDCDDAVSLFNKLLSDICNLTIPRKKSGRRTVPWWSQDLLKLRIDANRAKRQLLRARRLFMTDRLSSYEDVYKAARNKYVNEIKRRKRETWRNFVTVEGNRDPWSLVYKIVREKLRNAETVCSLKLPSGDMTMCWKDTLEILTRKASPSDVLEMENARHLEIRSLNKKYVNSNIEENITESEIENAMRRLKSNKAPGIDGFHNEVLRTLWMNKGIIIYNILNKCFRDSYFPRSWKTAELVFILKDKNRDRTEIGSYRPIALLPTFGKIYERIIVNRIQEKYADAGMESSRQFGFKSGRSTEDSFLCFREGVASTSKKYVVALFIDIEGAFDNLWWPAIIARVRVAGCSGTLVNIIKSYFNDRSVVTRSKFEKYERKVERGCPQGSILGPAAWNWAMDELLLKIERNFDENAAEVVAYADDLAFLIKANSRREVEEIGQRILQFLKEWCELYKLRVSTAKTTAMLLKGKLHRNRLPILKIDNKNVVYKSECKYLGLIIDDKLNFVMHAKFLRSKMVNFVMSVRRVARERWGIKRHIVDVLYNSVVLPIVTYGAAGWYDRTGHSLVGRNLLAAQRSILLVLSRACRTCATASLQVISGKPPLDLEVTRRGIIAKLKRNKSIIWKNYKFRRRVAEEEFLDLDLDLEIEKLNTEIEREWQRRWFLEKRGRETYNFIKNVSFVRENGWFRPSREVTYLITAYGPINATLFDRGISEEENCYKCGVRETVDHILFDCDLYQDLRDNWLNVQKNEKHKLIINEEMYVSFSEYARCIFEKRKNYKLEIQVHV